MAICINQFLSQKNTRGSLKLVSNIEFEQMVNGFSFGTFRPEKEKQDFLFSCFVAPGNFPLERQQKPCSIFSF